MKILKPGETITFGAAGNFKEFAAGGWSLGEDAQSFTWTLATEAHLDFKSGAYSMPLALKVEGFPFLAEGHINCQQVWVYLNGLYCGMFNATQPFSESLLIRGSWLEARANRITLTLPNARSPQALGLGADQRVLGLGLQMIGLIAT
jgi:hypothetical protein